jgi:SAM-dependent methyltransferase
MSESSRHDAWSAGNSYEAYMGRWSRQVAPRFLQWLAPAPGLAWLDVGCGTGALSAAIVAGCNPASVIGVDPSAAFVDLARQQVPDPRAAFRVGDAQHLPLPDEDRDLVVSALMLNFVPDKAQALREMRRVARAGGTVAFYVWDYPGGGVEFMRAFWVAAISLHPEAEGLAENKRFPYCTPEGLNTLLVAAGLNAAAIEAIEVPTVFASFEDYWRPFTLGAGPAPGYCMSLTESERQKLRDRLEASLPRAKDGSIPLQARAWAARTEAVARC